MKSHLKRQNEAIKAHLKLKKEGIVEVNTEDGDLKDLLAAYATQSLVTTVLGQRGSGKSAFSMRLMQHMETADNRKENAFYVLKWPEHIQLPKWLQKVEQMSLILPNSRVLIDDAARILDSRKSLSTANIQITEQMIISRHNDHSLVINLPYSNWLDRRAIQITDVLVIKQQSLLQMKFERPFMKDLYEEIKRYFPKNEDNRHKAYIYSDLFTGLVHFQKPSWFTTQISKAWRTIETTTQ